MTNAERQQRWRDKHRGKRTMQFDMQEGQQQLHLAAAPPAPAPALPVLPALDALPAALALKVLYETHVRAMPTRQRLQLARMIMDDLARTL